MSPLDALNEKFNRAVHHRDEWDAAFDRWLASNKPYTIRGRAIEETGWFEVSLVVREEVPGALFTIFADMISNLRATLDHVVWYLTTANGRDPDDRNIYFPCVTDIKNWPTNVGSQLKCFPPDWLHVIKQAQPFRYGGDYKRHPMYVLHHLDVRTKHRLLMPFAVTSFGMEPVFEFNRETQQGETYASVFWPVPELIDGANLMAFHMVSEHDDLRISRIVDDLPVHIGIGPVSDLTELRGYLPNLLVFVGTLVNEVAPAFA